MAARELTERADQMGEVLAGLECADRDDEGRAAELGLDVGRHLRGVAERRNPERDDDEAARGAEARPEDLLDLVGRRTRSRCAALRRARPLGG